MRFYGLNLDEVYRLENCEATVLIQAIQALEAQEHLAYLRMHDWPHMKKDARNKLFRDLNKLANPVILREERKPLTTEDLAAILNRG